MSGTRHTIDYDLLWQTTSSILSSLSSLRINRRKIKMIKGGDVIVGGYGDVRQAKLQTSFFGPDILVAIKVLRPTGNREQRIRVIAALARELKVWSKLNHQNILTLEGFYFDESSLSEAWIMTLWQRNGNILKYLEVTQPDQKTRLKLALDTAQGLAYLHSLSPPVCHGDIKGENTIIDNDGNALLCDFGLSRLLESGASGLTTTSTPSRTLRYAAPELVIGDGTTHTLASDAWAWGCLLLVVTTDVQPYATKLQAASITSAICQLELPANVSTIGASAIVRNILEKCWQREPESRPELAWCEATLQAPTDQPLPGPVEPTHFDSSPSPVSQPLPVSPPSSLYNHRPPYIKLNPLPSLPRTPSPRSVPVPPTFAVAAGPPSIVAPLPTITTLTLAASAASISNDPAAQIRWSKDVLRLVQRIHPSSDRAEDAASHITDPDLLLLVNTAIDYVLSISGASSDEKKPIYVAEALYLRASLKASGSFPTYIPRDLRTAFRDFESAARAGYHAAWFRLGRDYETCSDVARARTCFQRGVSSNETSCIYRMGMAYLFGQLDLQQDHQVGLSLLKQAAGQADLDVPQPAYTLGVLLLGEIETLDLPIHLIMSIVPPATANNPDTRTAEARKNIERAAYLGYSPAQYKLGWAYEFAKMGCPFDSLLSVQYYSLASQGGQHEADMALSKWFLCGCEGHFEKDEALALTFAEKAAKKGLPSAEFAMGYYCEVGVGRPIDIDAAKDWYLKAIEHNSLEAIPRLNALSGGLQGTPPPREHSRPTDAVQVRERTAQIYNYVTDRAHEFR